MGRASVAFYIQRDTVHARVSLGCVVAGSFVKFTKEPDVPPKYNLLSGDLCPEP
eukprot:SAG31_NODE_18156_length_645_cov_0.908425_1_plen_53_part_10